MIGKQAGRADLLKGKALKNSAAGNRAASTSCAPSQRQVALTSVPLLVTKGSQTLYSDRLENGDSNNHCFSNDFSLALSPLKRVF